MYEKLSHDFKNELIDRQIDRKIVALISVLTILYLVPVFFIWWKLRHWAVIVISDIALIILFIIIGYSMAFSVLKKKGVVNKKDYFHVKLITKSLMISNKDIDILKPLLKTHGINTRAKVKEAINYYRAKLGRKSHQSFTIISVLSLIVSIMGIIFSYIKCQSNEELFVTMILLFLIIFFVSLLCIGIKQIYRSIYYNLSEYALYERIEEALSEIWMKQLI